MVAVMDAVTPKQSSKHDTPDTHSHVVRPADMEWKKTRFAGCEVKGLLLDKSTGLVTALMRYCNGTSSNFTSCSWESGAAMYLKETASAISGSMPSMRSGSTLFLG